MLPKVAEPYQLLLVQQEEPEALGLGEQQQEQQQEQEQEQEKQSRAQEPPGRAAAPRSMIAGSREVAIARDPGGR